MPASRNRISAITRRKLFDSIALSGLGWSGRLQEPDFLGRLYDLSSLPSTDTRYRDAHGDIWQHRVNNYDWDDDWVFSDSRFNLAHGDDDVVLAFLAEICIPSFVPTNRRSRRSSRASTRRWPATGMNCMPPIGLAGTLSMAGGDSTRFTAQRPSCV